MNQVLRGYLLYTYIPTYTVLSVSSKTGWLRGTRRVMPKVNIIYSGDGRDEQIKPFPKTRKLGEGNHALYGWSHTLNEKGEIFSIFTT